MLVPWLAHSLAIYWRYGCCHHLQFPALHGQIRSYFDQLKHTSPINIDRIRPFVSGRLCLLLLQLEVADVPVFLPIWLIVVLIFALILQQLMPSMQSIPPEPGAHHSNDNVLID
jgi:hypothetical protein